MAIYMDTDMLYTRAGESDVSNVLSAHNPLIWEFSENQSPVWTNPLATIQFVVKNNAAGTIYTSAVFSCYLYEIEDDAPAEIYHWRFDGTEIIKHIINNYFFKELTASVLGALNYGSYVQVTIKSYDGVTLKDTEVIEYFASHAVNQIGDEYGANIPRLMYNDTEEIAHFLGFPQHLFFFSWDSLATEDPIIEILPSIANQITSWTNILYDTFTSSGAEITSAIDAADGLAITNEFSIVAGESVRLVFDLTLNAGAQPDFWLRNEATDLDISSLVGSVSGDNYIILTAELTCNCYICVSADGANNFLTDAIHAQLLKGYSEEGTLGLFMHTIVLSVFQFTKESKQVKFLSDAVLIKTYNLTVFQPCENAIYIRFLTKDGYYMYFAFSPYPSRSVEGEKIGNVINSFSEMALANSRNYPIGYKNSFNKIACIASSVPIVFRRKLMELFISPAVYLWQGKQTPDENLITKFPSNTYDTFETSGTVIISAINTAGDAYAWTDSFNVTIGETISVLVYIITNPGEAPSIAIDDLGGAGVISNVEALSAGYNNIELVITATADGARLRISNTAASAFETKKIIVKRAEVETDWILLEGVEGSHQLREKKDFDNFECTLVLPENFTQTLGRVDV